MLHDSPAPHKRRRIGAEGFAVAGLARVVRGLRLRNILAIAFAASTVASGTAAGQRAAALPFAVTNNAVAGGMIDGRAWLFSALGVDTSRRWTGITRRAVAWSSETGAWRALPDVPGAHGRLAATAQVVRGRLYVLGGYTVDSTGAEKSLPNVDVYVPRDNRWARGSDMPVAVDDAVSGVYRDSLIYVVSGWHDTDNVQDVQVYDVVNDRWSAATPIRGPGVFGHGGGLSGNTIVLVDGVVRQATGAKYRLLSQVWVGTIDPAHPTDIAWRAGPAHPGPARYRAAVGRCGDRIVFAGGASTPYNYDGMGYDGVASAPMASVIAFDARRGAWDALALLAVATMDHRGLAIRGDTGWVIGGMRGAQRVTNALAPVPLAACR